MEQNMIEKLIKQLGDKAIKIGGTIYPIKGSIFGNEEETLALLSELESKQPDFKIDQLVYYNDDFDESYYIEEIHINITNEGANITYDLSHIHSSVYKTYTKEARSNICVMFDCEETKLTDAKWYDEEYRNDER